MPIGCRASIFFFYRDFFGPWNSPSRSKIPPSRTLSIHLNQRVRPTRTMHFFLLANVPKYYEIPFLTLARR